MLGLPKKRPVFSAGNRVELLVNGETFFPRLIERIDAAQKEIIIETYILADDPIGNKLKDALKQAADRGVWVCLTVDSLGSCELSSSFIEELTGAGIVFQVYDPQPLSRSLRFKVLRRLHRKMVIIDGVYAFIGGMNISHDQMLEFGAEAKQDYSAEVQGPVVKDIRSLALTIIPDREPDIVDKSSGKDKRTGASSVALVFRDNHHHRRDIERAYLSAIRAARVRIWIANAYFFPSYRFIWALRRARRKGVDVRLIMQGSPDVPIALMAVRALYEKFIRSGVKIYEYKVRQLHAKIAVVDDQWSTIGSSNLDPVSLVFNLEANLLVQDRDFNQCLANQLQTLQDQSELITQEWVKRRGWLLLVKDFVMYQVLRRFPAVGGLIPSYTPEVLKVAHSGPPVSSNKKGGKSLVLSKKPTVQRVSPNK